MPASDIVVKGARENNLRDVDLVLPRNQLICLTGVSGSGKSSFAFDTLYAEGQRRYIESLSSFARQFLGQLPKPDVDFISGLSPAISISQKAAGNNPRSTVGTITEIYDYLRVLFARVGTGFCPHCGNEITAQTREQILTRIQSLPPGTRFVILAPLIRQQKGEYRDLFEDLLKQGFVRARVDGQVVSLSDNLQLDRQMRHDIEVVVDRLAIKDDIRPRLAEATELALRLGKGTMVVATQSDNEQTTDTIYSTEYACLDCGKSFSPLSPQLFSFNSPQGMCSQCDGLGELYSFDPKLLIPDPDKSFKAGCFEIIGPWKELGRWRRHIYDGVAETMERKLELAEGTLLESAWSELNSEQQNIWMWGTGEEHITFTWRAGRSPIKYGGPFEGVVPELLSKHRNSKSRIQIRRLEAYMKTLPCPECSGARLVAQARAVQIASQHPRFAKHPWRSLPELCDLTVLDISEFLSSVELDATKTIIAAEVLKEIRARLGFLLNVGLEYLTLNRTAPTLSGGESQRIRLAGQIGSGLVGVMYILDEPSIGLHPRDNDRLLESLQQLRDMGNTVVVVEHDEDTMMAADHIVDFGPGPGVRGGELVVAGSVKDVRGSSASVTGQFLSGKRKISIPSTRRKGSGNQLIVRAAAHNNLREVDVEIPLGSFVCVTGVSGSGKSSLVNDILIEALRRDLNNGNGEPGAHAAIEGIEHLDKMIAIDQSPIGRTPRSNPGTYIKVFDDIRNLFAKLSDAKKRGYKPGRFSFNVKGGRCEACEGNGSNRLEMDFLADVWVTCPVCQGKRFNRETLQVTFKDKSVSDVLQMDVQEALDLFENIPRVHHKLQTLHDVGLDYLKIGQPSPTLSGGEAQRIKLARELVKKSTGQTLYLLDEPTTGLHFADIEMLLRVLHNFAEAGNTVLVVEHNLDVIKTADWVIDLGPEGGAGGGAIVAAGPPETVAAEEKSHTGRCLAEILLPSNGRARKKKPKSRSRDKKNGRARTNGETRTIRVEGASQHNLRKVDVEIARDKLTVFCGPSGSGKTSLAMDTIYAEGQRRYVESLSAYARQFVSQMQKPKLDHIDGLSPAIAIEQKNLGHTPRSTVGTVTEIYDYLRILCARLGVPHCPACEIPIGTQTSDEIVDKILELEEGTRLFLMAPIDVAVGEKYETLWDDLRKAGYARVRLDGLVYELNDVPKIDRRRKHDVEVVVDRVIVRLRARSRIADSVEHTLALGNGVLNIAEPLDDIPPDQWETRVHSQHLACHNCGQSFDPLTPHSFSFNSSLGWCSSCEGLGVQTGANLSAIVDSKLTLLEGALRLWPSVDKRVSQSMLAALSRETGIPLDVQFQRLTTRHRRLLLHGTDDRWFSVYRSKKPKRNETAVFRFQFKGLYPSLEEASRISPSFRTKLESFVDEVDCSSCSGSRLREDASAVRLQGQTIDQVCRLPLGDLLECVQKWNWDKREQRVAGELLREIENRLQFLNDVGLHYLTLSRSAASLSNGEAQRIRLASQLGSGLCGVLYVLDEPTIGLHPRDNRRLIGALHKLRDLGNTLLIVEHDRDVIASADYLCDFGPGAGKLGGQIVAHGTPQAAGRMRDSVTGPYLSGKRAISVPSNRRMIPLDLPKTKPKTKSKRSSAAKKTKTPVLPQRPHERWHEIETPHVIYEPPEGQWLEIIAARHNNLKDVDVRFPLGTLTAVTGPSGSGKSSLINDVLHAALAKVLHRASIVPGAHQEIRGLEAINKVIRVDQQPLGNSPASNPATYTGAFDLIRTMFSQLPDSRLRGYTARRFSFNVPGGRCDHCEGYGQRCIEMHFLPDVWVTCETCDGKRYNPETLGVKYRGRSIAEVLELTCGEALELFVNVPKIGRILQTLCDVGLDYLTLGQSAPTLSGGEAQRVKLAAELARPDTGRTLYLLDEPTTGLHFDDLVKLLGVMHRLVDLGNTVVVIEHNLDIIKCADWLIDMGPDAGEDGGRVVGAGTPEQLVEFSQNAKNRCDTGIVLGETIALGPYSDRTVFDLADSTQKTGHEEIDQVGKQVAMPWENAGREWHTQFRVDRKGEPCKWDGRILAEVVDRIQAVGEFAKTNWNARSVVEITGKTKSQGWFLHAITAETWIVKLKFRIAKSTFKQAELQTQLPLKTLNELHHLPVYSNEPRVRCKNLRGPWQEVEIRAHSWEEINLDAFWSFLDSAVAGFFKQTAKVEADPETHMPWKKLGQKWHFLRKGFPTGKRVRWGIEVWERLHQLMEKVSPKAQFVWTNKVLVRVNLPKQRLPWAYINTKKPETLDLALMGPKNGVTLGEFAELGLDREFDSSHADYDVVRIRFSELKEVDEQVENLLIKHLGYRETA